MVHTPREFSAFTHAVLRPRVSERNGQRLARWSLIAAALADTVGKMRCPNHSDTCGRRVGFLLRLELSVGGGCGLMLICPFADCRAESNQNALTDKLPILSDQGHRTTPERVPYALA